MAINVKEIAYLKLRGFRGLSKLLLIDRQIIEDIENREYTPKAGDRLYFEKGCKTPRIKVREFLGPKDVSVTIKKPLATHLVINENIDKTLKLRTYLYMNTIPPEAFGAFIENLEALITKIEVTREPILSHYFSSIINPDTKKIKEEAVEQQVNILKEFKDYLVKTKAHSFLTEGGYTDLHEFKYTDKRGGSSRILNSSYVYRNHVQLDKDLVCFLVDPTNEEHMDFVRNNKRYYIDSNINKAISEEMDTDIDEELLDQLTDMLMSQDYDTNKMALEIMSNCNYNNNLLKIIYLLTFCVGDILSGSISGLNVNIQSFLKAVNFNPNYIGRRYNNTTLTLRNFETFCNANNIKELKDDLVTKKLEEFIIKELRNTFDRFQNSMIQIDEENTIIKLKKIT